MLSTLVFGRDVFSYVKTFGSSARDAIKSEVPIEFEIQRARDMVGNLVPDIRKCMHVIAEEEVNVEHLSKEIARAESDMNKQKEDLACRDVDQRHRPSVRQPRTSNESARSSIAICPHKTAEATLGSSARFWRPARRRLRGREKLDGVWASTRSEVRIENLDARLKTVQAGDGQRRSARRLQLARAKKLIGDLNKQQTWPRRCRCRQQFHRPDSVETADRSGEPVESDRRMLRQALARRRAGRQSVPTGSLWKSSSSCDDSPCRATGLLN